MEQKEFLRQWRESKRELLASSAMPGTLNEDARTVDCVFFTGADIPRYDWWTDTSYTLRFDPAGADLSLLNNKAPVCVDHSTFDVGDQMGVVQKAWKENGQYRASLQFKRSTELTGPRPEVDGLWQDIKDGIQTKFSMGVEMLEFTDTRNKDSKLELRTVTKWQPFEISLVSVPADFGTTTLSATQQTLALTDPEPSASEPIETGPKAQKEKLTMDNPQVTVAAEAPALAPVDTEALKMQAITAERTRAATILSRVKTAGLPAEFAAALIAEGVNGEQLTDRIFAEMAKAEPPAPAQRPHAEITRDADLTRRQAIGAALLNRHSMSAYPLKDGLGREYTGMSLMEIAKECLQARGVTYKGESKSRIAELALTVSDFPLITADVANKTLRAAYQMAPRTFVPFCRQATAPDFKNINRVALGENPGLLQVTDNAEFKYGSVSESREQYKLATYGRIVAITRQTIINDDLGAFTRIPGQYGVAAATLESDTVWAIVTANAALADGVALFDNSTHLNLNSSTALSVANLGVAMSRMSRQTGIDGVTILSVQPRYLIGPTALQLTMSQIVGVNMVPAQATNVVPEYMRMLTPIAEPRLDTDSATSWYLSADPGQIDTIEYCYLEGEQGVYLEQRIGFEVDGVEFKARLDFAAKALDYRGLAKNTA